MSRIIEVDEVIVVSQLAEKLEIPVTNLITNLFKNGITVTLNEKIDFETASLLIEELGLDVKINKKVDQPVTTPARKAKSKSAKKDLVPRPVVVSIMGHVDHGKTTLLDKIRGGKQVEREVGGITQHINAYNVDINDKQITFLDTPGHEAFSNIREHGAVLTDLALIVVAADDGIKDQTIEAIRFAKKNQNNIIVAANKIDSKQANLSLVHQQLAENDLAPESLGGKITVVPVSAKTGEGIDELLEIISLTAGVENFQADYHGPAEGLVIEAHVEKGLGPTAVVLVQEGTLQLSDFIVSGSAWGKVRTLHNTDGKPLKQVTPALAARVSGFKTIPDFGDSFFVVSSEKEARTLAENHKLAQGIKTKGMSNQELIRIISRRNLVDEYNIILKADSRGSLASVLDGIKTLETDDVAIRVVSSGIGVVSENDIQLAKTTEAHIYCFNIQNPLSIKRISRQQDVVIKEYSIIYNILDDIKQELERLLKPEVITTELATLVVRGVFNTKKTGVICGGEITKGKLSLPATAQVIRNKELLAEAEVLEIKKAQQEVKEVGPNEMCGLKLKTENRLVLNEGDRLKFYRQEIKQRKLGE